MEDIENALTEEALETLHSSANWDGVTWGEQPTNAYTSSKSYPAIYAQENLSVIDGVKNTTGLGMSEQTSLIERTAAGATEGKLTATTSIQPYNTWNNFYTLNIAGCSWEEAISAAFKEGKGDLLFPNGINQCNWVASRCVYAYSNGCYFLVRCVYYGDLDGDRLYSSYDSAYSDALGLFPVVSLAANLLGEGTSTDWAVK